MYDSSKPLKLFIVYSDKDEPLYKEMTNYLDLLKSKGQIDSWSTRRLSGEKWDQVIDRRLEISDIVLLLTSPDFLAHEYCYGDEVKNAVKLHNEGHIHLIPILARVTGGIEGTPFKDLKTLPVNGYPIESREWENKDDAFTDIIKGIVKVIRKLRETTDDCFMMKKKRVLPFCIKRFDIKNFLCIRDAGLDKIPVDCQWIFITGENGEGKTALLQAMALGLLGNDDREANHLLEDNTHIQIEFKQDGENTIHELYKDSDGWKNITTELSNIPLKNILGYGVSRLNIMTRQAEAEMVDKNSNPALSLYNETEGNFQNIETWLKDRYLESQLKETTQIRQVKDTLKELMPNIDKVEIEGKDIVYYEKGYKARYMEVSSGSKMIIAMIGDMIKRFFTAQPTANDISEFKGIVLIDELDLHLHPKWQIKLPVLLSRYFPNVQFWATTHSIIPFMGAPENSVYLKVTREKDMLTKVERLDIDIKKLLPNTLLSSPLFCLEDFIRKGVNDFRTEYLYSEYEKNKDTEEQLEKIAQELKLPKSYLFDDPGDTK